jgi:hypothetical protein
MLQSEPLLPVRLRNVRQRSRIHRGRSAQRPAAARGVWHRLRRRRGGSRRQKAKSSSLNRLGPRGPQRPGVGGDPLPLVERGHLRRRRQRWHPRWHPRRPLCCLRPRAHGSRACSNCSQWGTRLARLRVRCSVQMEMRTLRRLGCSIMLTRKNQCRSSHLDAPCTRRGSCRSAMVCSNPSLVHFVRPNWNWRVVSADCRNAKCCCLHTCVHYIDTLRLSCNLEHVVSRF